MRVQKASIEDAYFLHSNTLEYFEDIGERIDLPTHVWMEIFLNPNFICMLALHGKRQSVGQIWGYKDPLTKSFMVSGVFVRRKFRKKVKFLKPLVVAFKDVLKENDIKKLHFLGNDKTQKAALKRKFKMDSFILGRSL